MARLPHPGGDSGNWGSILNDFLAQVHASDGTLKTDSVTSDAIAPNAVTSAAIAPNSITNTALASNAVDAAIIQDGSITNALIADGAIEEAKLSTAVQAKLNQTAPVTSVAGKTGDVLLTESDVANLTTDLAAKEPTITAGATTQYYRGDKSWQTLNANSISDATTTGRSLLTATDAAAAKTALTLTKSDVGLGSVDNTSDATKNSATATLTNKDLTSATNTFPSSLVTKGVTSTATTGGTTTLTASSTPIQVFTGTLAQTVKLPGDVKAGTRIELFNNGSIGCQLIANSANGTTVGGTIWWGGYACAYIALVDNPSTGTDWRYSLIANQNNVYGMAIQSGLFTGSPTVTDPNFNSGARLTSGTLKGSTGTAIELYNTTDQTTNYERVQMFWSGNDFYINPQYGGTGSNRSIKIGAGTQLNVNASSSNGAVSIGTGGSTNNPTTIGLKIEPTHTAGAGVQLSQQIATTIDQSGTAGYTMLQINPTETATGSGTKLLIDAQVGGTSKFKVDNSGNVTLAGAIKDTNSNTILNFSAVSNPVGNISITNSASGIPVIKGEGSATDVYISLRPKGTGTVKITGDASQSSVELWGESSASNVDLNLVTKGSGIVKANGVNILTTSGSQNITNKTLNNSNIMMVTSFFDANVKMALTLNSTLNAVNYTSLTNSVTGSAPSISANGTDTDVSLNLKSKGAGVIQLNGVTAVDISSAQTLTNKTLTNPTINGTPVAPFADVYQGNSGKTLGSTLLTVMPYYRAAGDTNAQVFIPTLLNDLAYNIERGGTISVTKNGVTLTSGVDYNPYAVFNNGDISDGRGPGHGRGMEFYGSVGTPFLSTDTWILTIGVNSSTFATYGTTYGVEFVHGFGAKNVTIEAYFNGTWSTIYTVTNSTDSACEHWAYVQPVGNTVTQLRYTFTNLQSIGSSGCIRIRNIWMQNVNNGGFSFGYFTRGGGPLYGTSALPPKITASGSDANIGLNLGTKGTGTVQANGNPVGVKVAVPATATSAGVPGQWAADSSYHYICTATNTWMRVAIATW